MKDIHGISIDDGFKVRIWWRKGADTQEYYECDGRAVWSGEKFEFEIDDGRVFDEDYLKKVKACVEIKGPANSIKQKLIDAGYSDALVFENPSFSDSFVGVTHDGRAVYNYDQMIVDLMYEEGCSEEEAIDWIEYNTIRSIGYWGPKAPVVIHSIEEI